MKLKVVEGTQVKHDGKLYGPGDTFEASKADAERYGAWVTEVKRGRPKSTKKVASAGTKSTRKATRKTSRSR
jgi:hypothetical protein